MSELSEAAYIGVIRCQCGGQMEVDESAASATPDGICYTVECLECRETGGYNAETLEVFGAVDSLQIVGE